MRAFLNCSLALVSFAAILSSRALQQPLQPPAPPEGIDEVVVRGGKTLSQYRLELERAHDALLELFNESNEGNDTDVRCRNEAPTGTRIPQRVCRSQAEERAQANGVRQFLNSLLMSASRSPGGGDGGQVNSEVGMALALGNAEREGQSAEAQFEAEWRRVLVADSQFYEAAVEYAELEEEFDRLSGTTSAAARQPRQILLGPAGPQCEASTLTEFEQRNNVARVSGTVSISMCPAGTTGSFTLVAQVGDDAGETRPLEFVETWQRTDTQDHVFDSDYPIGENVFLQSVRVRSLTCTCESVTQ
jgi:hypothetical protein